MAATSILHGENAVASVHGEQLVHRVFERQVSLTPNHVAVQYGDEVLTYRALDERANQLANYLAALGALPETLVGICIDPSIDLLVAVIASLKAGAAYVPLDPRYPLKRLEFMIADARPSLILAQEAARKLLAPSLVPQVFVDSDWNRIAAADRSSPATNVSPRGLAYVIFTSGSTGNPKGVQVEHRGVVNYLGWCRHAYPLAAGSGAPVHSSLSFDLTVTSMLAPLIAGRTTVLVPPAAGVGSLARTVSNDRNFSLIKLTPLHLEMLSQLIDPTTVAGWARSFIIGGENLLTHQIAFWRQHAPETRLFNEYGPTETVVGCCVYEAAPNAVHGAAIPIGRPIDNMHLYVLDDKQRPITPGQEGELFIGGIGVARGYLDRPELTAERFLDNPFDDGRMYRTGDLVRCHPDGNLEFLGRIDEQIKVRGHRVEIGEIEAVLRQHPDVRESAVVVAGKGSNAKLIATIVPAAERPTLWSMKRYCADLLPYFMVIDGIRFVDELPSTPNGKVDKQRLTRDIEAEMAR